MSREFCAEKSREDLRETLAALYPQLRRIARQMLSRERRDHTLQPTALTNEAVARLLAREKNDPSPQSVLSFGIREMQTILIDSGRRRQTRTRHEADVAQGPQQRVLDELAHLRDCLEKLGQFDPRARQVVELRFFVGLTINEVAEILGVSSRTVNEDWEFARSWLSAHWASD